MIVGLAVLGIAVVGGVAFFLTTNNGQQASVARDPESRVRQADNRKDHIVASNDESSDFTETRASFGTTNSEGTREPGRSASENAKDSTARLPATGEEKASFGTPAPPAIQFRTDAPKQPTERPEQKPGAGSQLPVARVLSPEERLQELGLKRTGRIYILAQEADVEQRFNKSRSLFEEYRSNVYKKAAVESATVRMKQLVQDNRARDLSIDQLNQALGRQPPRPDNQVKAHFDAIRTRARPARIGQE